MIICANNDSTNHIDSHVLLSGEGNNDVDH